MQQIREICFDTETTGLDPKEGHRLIEIGCVEIIDGKRTKNFYHQMINPEREVPEDAVRIHGITTERLLNEPKFGNIVDNLLDFFGDSTIIAHNANFDIKFINYELEIIGREPLKNNVIDSLLLAKSKFPGQKNNLDALCKRYNIDNSRRTVHGALLDAELLTDVYIELNGGAQKSLIEDTKKASTESIDFEKYLKIIKSNKVLEIRNFQNSEIDKENHNKFLEKFIKNSIWNS